jgi:hypothetical protein
VRPFHCRSTASPSASYSFAYISARQHADKSALLVNHGQQRLALPVIGSKRLLHFSQGARRGSTATLVRITSRTKRISGGSTAYSRLK